MIFVEAEPKIRFSYNTYQRLYYLAQNFGSENWGYAAEGQGLARLVELQNNTLHLRVHRHVGTLADNIGTRQWK